MKKTKKVIAVLCILVTLATALTGCGGYTSNEECWLCGSTDEKTKMYKSSSGEKQYFCKECSTECFFCGEKATRHYTSLGEMVVFVCDECYEDMR